MGDGFEQAIEAGRSVKKTVQQTVEPVNISELRLEDNAKYQKILAECNAIHKQLLEYERENRANSYVDNPALLGEYLGKLRLNANLLFGFMNVYIDLISDLELEYARKRQKVYLEKLEETSSSQAETYSREVTRVDDAKINAVKSILLQIRNHYEQFNSICIYLQSRSKEFISERMMG